MQPIPTPQVLDPDRVLDNDRGDFTADHEARSKLLETALHESCSYAQQLWDTTNALRAYLMDSLPPDPRAPGAHPAVGASPTGPDDEQGWNNWVNAYAAVTSVLCGPHGDSGYGLGEARHAAELRRSAPNLTLYVDHPELSGDSEADATRANSGPRHTEEQHHNGGGPHGERAPATSALPKPVRLLAAGVVGVLALRGLRR